MPRQLPWKRGRAGRGPGIHPYPARRHRASGTRLPRPRLARKRSLKSPGVPSDQPPRAEPRAPGARLAAATAGEGPGRGRRIQDGGGQEEASSPVGGKGKSVAATPPAACAPGRGSRGHCRLPVGVHTGAAGGGGATVYLRSPSLHLSAPLLLLIFHVPSGPCRVAREATGPTRRRLRSIYTPSPFDRLALPCDNCHADVVPPRVWPRPWACAAGLAANQGPRSFTPARSGRCGPSGAPPLRASDRRNDAPISRVQWP